MRRFLPHHPAVDQAATSTRYVSARACSKLELSQSRHFATCREPALDGLEKSEGPGPAPPGPDRHLTHHQTRRARRSRSFYVRNWSVRARRTVLPPIAYGTAELPDENLSSAPAACVQSPRSLFAGGGLNG